MNKIKDLRLSNNLTQKKLSDYLGIAVNTFSQYENGLRQMPDELKSRLADYFDVSVDYLIGRTETSPEHPHLNIPDELKDIPVAFHGGLDGLSQDDIDDVKDFIEYIKNRKKK